MAFKAQASVWSQFLIVIRFCCPLPVLHMIYPIGKRLASDLHGPNSLFNRTPLQERNCSGPSLPASGDGIRGEFVPAG